MPSDSPTGRRGTLLKPLPRPTCSAAKVPRQLRLRVGLGPLRPVCHRAPKARARTTAATPTTQVVVPTPALQLPRQVGRHSSQHRGGKTEWPQGLTQPFEAGEPPPQPPLVFPKALAQAPSIAPVTKPKGAQGTFARPPRSSAPKPQPKIKNRKEPHPSSQLRLSQVFRGPSQAGSSAQQQPPLAAPTFPRSSSFPLCPP